MSADSSDGKGVKPPRTLFSLGRPGAKVERGGAAVAVDPPADVATEVADEEIQYACGACGALLPTGAAFCGECGTPVATDDYYEDELLHDEGMAPGGLLDEAVVADEEPLDAVAEAPEAPAAEVGEPAVAEAPESAVVDAPEPVVAETPVAEAPAAEAPAADHRSGWGAAAAGAAGVVAGAEAIDLVEEHGAADEVAAAPSNVLYADPSVVEPPPAPGDGGLQVSEPVSGSTTAADATVVSPAADDTQVVPAPTGAPGDVAAAPAAFDGAPVAPDDTTPGAGAWAGGAVAGAAVAGAAVAGAGAAEASPLSELSAPPAPPTSPALDGTGATDMPYGHGPLESSQKSKTPLILVGVGAFLVLAGIIGVIIAMGGSKNENVATAPSSTAAPSTTAKASTTTTASSSTSTSGVTTTTAESTTTTAAPETSTTAAPTTQATSAPQQVVTPGLPSSVVTSPPQVTPGRIVANPGSGSRINVAKGGSFTITLQNVGGSSATYSLRSTDGKFVGGGSGAIPANASAQVRFTANPNAEGDTGVTGVVEGIGGYTLIVRIGNG
ncbi:MAG: hypothetical protein U0Q07_07295 [Acidimicrobiales bacterium]